MGTSPPEIQKKVLEVRKLVGGLEAKKTAGGPSFATKSAKELLGKLRNALDLTGCTISVVKQDIINIPAESVPPDGKGRTVRSAVTIQTLVRLGAPDGSFIESWGSGGGLDADDKAVGKASTYSFKDAVIKMLTMPDAQLHDADDEQGAGAVAPPSVILQTYLTELAESGDMALVRALYARAKEDATLKLPEKRVLAIAVKERVEALK